MSAAEILRGRWVRRIVDETLRHAIFDARQILFMADFHVCGMNLRSLHGTERMRELAYVEIECSLRFGGSFLFEFTVCGCLRHKFYRARSLAEMSQRLFPYLSDCVSV